MLLKTAVVVTTTGEISRIPLLGLLVFSMKPYEPFNRSKVEGDVRSVVLLTGRHRRSMKKSETRAGNPTVIVLLVAMPANRTVS